jgi:hypothetical protein
VLNMLEEKSCKNMGEDKLNMIFNKCRLILHRDEQLSRSCLWVGKVQRERECICPEKSMPLGQPQPF